MSVLCVSREYLLELGDGIKQQMWKRRLGGKGLCDPQVAREEKKGCRKGSAAETRMRLEEDWIWRRGGIGEYLLLACLFPWPASLVCLQGMPLTVGGWDTENSWGKDGLKRTSRPNGNVVREERRPPLVVYYGVWDKTWQIGTRRAEGDVNILQSVYLFPWKGWPLDCKEVPDGIGVWDKAIGWGEWLGQEIYRIHSR